MPKISRTSTSRTSTSRTSTIRMLALLAAGAALVSSPALARPRHHNLARGYSTGPAPYASSYAGGWQAEANARLTAQAYRDPGVTLELAPDAKQTATGGPVGGVPGFSGGM